MGFSAKQVCLPEECPRSARAIIINKVFKFPLDMVFT